MDDTIDYGFALQASSSTNGIRGWSCKICLTPSLNKYSNLEVLTWAPAIEININK